VVMCCSLVQVVGAGGKWKVFSGDVWWFGPGWGRLGEMERFEWYFVVVWDTWGETEGNRKFSVVLGGVC
jgi:hypothetical protein